MCAAMLHRGPDEDGMLIRSSVGLGMQRLRIIDLSTGKQPIFNEDGSIGIVYNGEFYSYRDLRRDLEEAGHQFRTQTDTEVIVHAYEQ
jgi:asparagine synthase (glutamine-hydrolysing)